jgi:DNA invertase Pin-like site-specific DNA recombinase
MGHLIGYARVSTTDQDLSLQLDALRHAGCREAWIFRDTTAGARTARPGLEACLRALEPGDTLVVWRLDRLGRSMTHLVTVIEELLGRQVGFRALCDGAIDTTSASGELIFHIFSALVQFERRLIQERTRAGLAAARARGKKGGRQPRHAGEPRVRIGLHPVCGPTAVCRRHLSDLTHLTGDVLSLCGVGETGGRRAVT